MAEIDPRILEELNQNLRDLSQDLNRMGSDRIIVAMGKISQQLDKKTQQNINETERIKRFVSQVDKATQAVQSQAQTTQATAQAQNQLNSAARDLGRMLRDVAEERGSLLTGQQRQQRELQGIAQSRLQSDFQYLRSLSTVRGSLTALAGSSRLSNRAFRNLNIGLILGGEALSSLKKTLGSLGNSLSSIASAGFSTAASLAKGETSVTVFNSMIDAGARALSDLGKSIPLFGAAISAVAGVSKFLLDMLQMVTDSMNTVAQVGSLAADGMDGFVASTDRAGLALKQMEKVTTENGLTMARFGGTVGDGLKRFSKITGDVIKTDLGRELRFLGFNREQIAEATAGFLNQQIRLGGARAKSDAELTRGAAQYARELDALAKLTGMQRSEIQKQQDAAMSEARFRARMDELGPNEAKRYLDFQSVLNRAAPGLAQGFRDLVSGYATTDAAQDFLRLGGQSVIDAIAGGGGPVDAFKRLQQVIEPQIGMAQSLAMVGGEDIKLFGKYVELRDVLNAKIIDGDIKLQQAQQTQINSAGALTTSIVSATETMDALQRSMQQLALSLAPHATKMVNLFAGALEKGVGKIMEILGLGDGEGSIWRIVGVTAGAVLGKTIGSMLGGLLGAITGFLIGGPIGAALGAVAGSAGGTALGAIFGGGAGYAVGGAMDRGSTMSQAFGTFGRAMIPEIMGGGRGSRGRERGAGVHGDEIEAQSGRVYRLDDAVAFGGGLTGTREHFQRLDPNFRERLFAMAVEYRNTTGRPMPFQSGHRSEQENAQVGGASDSLHLRGLAADLGSATVRDLQSRGLLEQFGFRIGDYPGSTGSHIYRQGGIAMGPDSGYMATLHGREAVVPLPDGRTIPVELKPGALDPAMDRMGQRLENALRNSLDSARSSSALESTLQEVVRVMRDQLSISQKMLQAAQN